MQTKRATIFLGGFLVLILSLLLTTTGAQAAPLVDVPVTVTQPDGTQVALLATGDEYYNWLHDAQGYTVMQDPVTGYYVYADLLNGELVPTKLVAGKDDPAAAGLAPHLNISPKKMESLRQAFLGKAPMNAAGKINNAPKTGTINNIVVFIRFYGESEFTTPKSTYSTMLNSSAPGADSLRSYYLQASYNKLTINSGLYPIPPGTTVVSYRDAHKRGYYQPYNAVTNPGGYTGGDDGDVRRQREHALLYNAIAYINGLNQFPAAASIDGDGDGYVDSITFVIKGSPDGWASLLWPHMWSLWSYDAQIRGKHVWGYSFHLQTYVNTGVLAHEMFHVLGAPDLYHYSYDGLSPAGSWDVMEQTADPPQHMSCYMKYKYGHWITTLPVLTWGNSYTLNALTSSANNCFKIRSPNATNQFFIVEYRRAVGTFESWLPGSGLLVWRIDTRESGNAYGPPDEIYVYRPGGTTMLDGDVYSANFSSDVGRTQIYDTTNPSSFLQDGSPGGLDLCNVGSAAGATISFDLGKCALITISGNVDVPNATIAYTGGSTLADLAGNYMFSVYRGWSGKVTPSAAGFAFAPASLSYTHQTSSLSGQSFIAYPTSMQSFTSTGAQDGWILESGENTSVGGSLNATGTTVRLGDDVANKQYRIILSFPTATLLPDTAVVTKATLTLRRQAVLPIGTNPISGLQGMFVEVRNGYFGSSPSLQLGDFQIAPPLVRAGPYTPALVGGAYTIDLSTAARAQINTGLTGLTQMRLRLKLDDNNNLANDYVSFFSGNYTTNPAYRPTLTITYYVP